MFKNQRGSHAFAKIYRRLEALKGQIGVLMASKAARISAVPLAG